MNKLAILMLIASALCACASYQELKAPCSPLDCTDRTPVNSWPAE